MAYGEEICRRFKLEMLRFANSGTEATMDAIRVARAATGRDVVCKIEGSYHGHHDAVMFSVIPNADVMGGRERPAKAPVSRGMVKDAHRYIEVVPFNDAAALEKLFDAQGKEIACLIMEPAMMNIGIVVPDSRAISSGCASCAPGTAWSSSTTRSRPASPSPPAAPPSASGCSRTWSASPRRSPAGYPARRSAAGPTSCG